jgi:two-component system, NarL family, nitrate/nitrite response regulator NarL
MKGRGVPLMARQGFVAAVSGRGSCMIKVLVLSDVRLYRDGIVACLARSAKLTVVGVAAYRLEAIHRARSLGPDVALADLSDPSNLHVVRTLSTTFPRLRIVALAVWEVEQDIAACADAGVHGYVSPDASIEELIAVTERVMGGDSFCSAETAALARQLSGHPSEATGADVLTWRERQIGHLIERGMSNKEIAGALSIELPTVKNHVHNILEKLHAKRRGEVAAQFRSAGAADATPRAPRAARYTVTSS